MKDERYQQLMIDVGLPDSQALLVALKQVANEAAQEIKSPAALERMAAIEHAQWAHWTKYMLENLTPRNVSRWITQIETPYNELTDIEIMSFVAT